MSSENTRGSQGTPTPSGSHHPSVSNLRVTPSPAGSAGSRSNTPASVTGKAYISLRDLFSLNIFLLFGFI